MVKVHVFIVFKLMMSSDFLYSRKYPKLNLKKMNKKIWGGPYSTGHSQHDTDFAKTNQNEVVRIRTNFFEDFRIHKLIRDIELTEENW